MNYYIQGNAAKAEQIKAAFEKLVIDVLDFGFADKTVVYCSIGGCGGCVQSLPYSINLMHILHSHPDYKELELPVEPKFKVGDWIVRGEGFVYEPSLITEIRDYYICELLNGERATYTLNDVHKNFHLWTIEDAKDGDVISLSNKACLFIFVFKMINHNNGVIYHCYCKGHTFDVGESGVVMGFTSDKDNHYTPATKEQRDLLFQKMKEAGYEWDADKKELLKIKHYAIVNFQPFDKVLTRDTEHGHWNVNLFSYYIDDKDERVIARFRCINSLWKQCIPFNDDTKHLLGTTDMCDEQYINW